MYGMGQFPGFTLFADINQAWDYIRQNIREVQALPGRLHVKQQEAAALARMAAEMGEVEGEARARELVREFGELKLEAQDVAQRVDDMMSRVPGLGAVPVAILALGAGVVIALAITIQALFRKASERERELALVEEGILTPDQVKELRRSIPTGPLTGLADTAKWLALGAGLLVGIPLLAKVKR